MTLIAIMMLAADPLAANPLAEPLPEVVLLDFTASYCGPCQEMVPAIQSMEKDGFPIRKVDTTRNPSIVKQFDVQSIPAFILLVNGQEKKRIVGKCSGEQLRRIMIEEHNKLRAQRRSAEEVTPSLPDPQPVAQKQRPGGLQGLFAMIRNGFGGRTQNTGFLHPTFRAQSPEPLPAESDAEDAMAATIRVRVTKQGNKEDVGTGSVIHSTPETSTILTCAHLFYDLGQGSTIEVEVFRDGRTLRYPAEIVATGNRDDGLDVAILQIQNNSELPTVELAPMPVDVRSGDAAFSIGCNHGQLPTSMPTRVVDIDRYDGPSNIVCTIDPAVGRSGGGLFNASGQLIGVCSCADRDQHEGLYMGRKPIHKLFAEARLSHLLMAERESEDPATFSRESDLSDDELFAELVNDRSSGVVRTDDNGFAESFADSKTAGSGAAHESDNIGHLTATRNDAGGEKSPPLEVTVIINSVDGTRPKEFVVIKQPSPWLLELLTGEAPAGPELAAARRSELSSTSARQTKHASTQSRDPQPTARRLVRRKRPESNANPTAAIRSARMRTAELR